MISISSDSSISLTRGNSADLSISISYDDGEPYIMSEGDVVCFTVRNSKNQIVLKKVYSDEDMIGDGSVIIEIKPSDTLDLSIGEYKYDVILVTAEGNAYTFIGKARFFLIEAIGTIIDVGGDAD